MLCDVVLFVLELKQSSNSCLYPPFWMNIECQHRYYMFILGLEMRAPLHMFTVEEELSIRVAVFPTGRSNFTWFFITTNLLETV